MLIPLWAGWMILAAASTWFFACLVVLLRPGRDGGPAARLGIPRRPHRESRTAFNFWNALTRTEQHALVSVAVRRTYPRGAAIFQEGQPADHVVVIRSGWTKICVHEHGQEQLLAERGPGELIGERAALQDDNVRSATVVALDTVDALVLRTRVFANFISRYPRVLDIVEGQVYDRLTQSSRDGRRTVPETRSAIAPSPDGHLPRLNGHSCTIVMTDIVGFNAPVRTADDRVFIQQKSLTMTRDTFLYAGIPWEECHRRDLGDGQLVVIPPAIPPAAVMRALALLPTELKVYNRRSAPAVQIRLRVAVHLGPVMTTNDFGLAGDALVHAARLLDAGVFKRAMAETGALLGVIASIHIYDTVIKDLDMEGYRKVRGKVKESRLVAWMQLTGRELPPV